MKLANRIDNLKVREMRYDCLEIEVYKLFCTLYCLRSLLDRSLLYKARKKLLRFMDKYGRYSDKEGVNTFEHDYRIYVDQGYRFGQKVRVKRGDEIVMGTVTGLTPDVTYLKSYIELCPPTITVEATWRSGRTTEMSFDPETKFPIDWTGQKFRDLELLD